MRNYKNFNIPMIKKHLKAIEEFKYKIDLNQISENNIAYLENTIKFYKDVLNQNEIATYFDHSKEASLLDIRDFNNKYLKLIEYYIPCYETFNDRAYTAIEKYDLRQAVIFSRIWFESMVYKYLRKKGIRVN